MCMLCRHLPCLPDCPNCEIEEVCECDYCRDTIVVGEKYYEYDGKCYHSECFEEIAVDLLIEDGATEYREE